MADSTVPPVPNYTNNQALQNLWPTIYGSATQYGVDPYVAYAMAVQEGGINSNGTLNTSSAGAIGVMQLEPSTAASLGIDPTNNAQNIDGGMQYLSQQLNNYGGNYSLALAAYNAGPGNVNKYGGVPPFSQTQNYVNNILATSSGDSDTTSSTSATTPQATDYVPLTNNASSVNQADLVPMIVVTEGLDVTPWFKSTGLITGHPQARKNIQPVSFQVMLHNNNEFILSSKGTTGIPIDIQLNASMKDISWSMKHLYNHQRTRTAHHITQWGMQADIIEGHCSTGVFMNQLGITDYFSTRTINDQLQKLVTGGTLFTSATTNSSIGTVSPTTSILGGNGANGGVVSQIPYNGSEDFSSLMAKLQSGTVSQSDVFRVAAQDAFMEFLALFKMNGSVWFWNKQYQVQTGEKRDWSLVDAWSPILGMNSAQKNARNNDVVTRGKVIMKYRNFVYEGYFKSLQWVMDANKPFSWDFNFVFQVERTIGQQYMPSSTGATSSQTLQRRSS